MIFLFSDKTLGLFKTSSGSSTDPAVNQVQLSYSMGTVVNLEDFQHNKRLHWHYYKFNKKLARHSENHRKHNSVRKKSCKGQILK